MSYKDFVLINVTVDKKAYHVNEPISGKVRIKNNSPIQLKLENIQLRLLLKHHGRGETDSSVMHRFTIHDYKSLSIGQVITCDFEFPRAGNVSFVGKNMTQSIIIQTKVDITKESERALRNEKISNFKIVGYIKGVFRPDFYDEEPVKVVRGDVNYHLGSASGVIRPGIKKSLITLGVALVACSVLGGFLYNMSKDPLALYLALGLFAIVAAVVYFLKLGPYLSIGKIDFQLKNLEGNFYEVNLDFEKRSYEIESISYQILARESVTYNNGSSRTTVRHTLYKSKESTIPSKGRKLVHKADLPSKSLPITIDNNDFKVDWFFNIKVVTRGNKTVEGRSKFILTFEKPKEV